MVWACITGDIICSVKMKTSVYMLHVYLLLFLFFHHGQQYVRRLVVQLTLPYVLMCFLNMLLAEQINE